MSDRHIQASFVNEGDEVHLRFMGGEEYVTVDKVEYPEEYMVRLTMSSSVVPEIVNTIPSNQEVRVKIDGVR